MLTLKDSAPSMSSSHLDIEPSLLDLPVDWVYTIDGIYTS